MRAVDTNILVRIMTRDDEKQLAAAEAYVANGAWISTVVLAEAIWVLGASYDLGHDEMATFVEMLLSHEHFALQDPEVVSAALAQYRAVPSLGFSDCLALEVAKKAGHLPLGTFDKRLSKIAGAERV